jgi:hypothetical protein
MNEMRYFFIDHPLEKVDEGVPPARTARTR